MSLLYAYGPQKPVGLVENTELSQYVIKYLGLEPLSKVTNMRFIPAKEHYEKLGYKTRIEHAVFIAEKDGEKLEFPAHQNVKIVNGKPLKQKKESTFIMAILFGCVPNNLKSSRPYRQAVLIYLRAVIICSWAILTISLTMLPPMGPPIFPACSEVS